MRALLALFVRSLREDARARLPVILRTLLVVVILLILWANERSFTSRTAPGREFLGMVLFANLGLLAIATPGIFATAITEEKEDQTLTLLRMTRLNPLAILLGKSTTRLVGALLLLAVQIPFTVLAVTLGGVSMDQVFGAYAVLGATTFLLCNLALLCSVLSRNGIRAGIWTGVVCAVVFIVLPFICIVTALERLPFGALTPSTAWEHFGTWLVESNPAYTLAVMLFEPMKTAPVARHIAVNLAAAALCFAFAWLAFDRFCVGDGQPSAARKATGRFRIFSGRRPRPSARRPIAWKDFHFIVGGWRGLLIRVGVCGLILFAAYSFERWVEKRDPDDGYFWRNVGEIAMVLSVGAFAIDGGLTASRIFGEERRNLTLGGLVTLPQHLGKLMRQKVAGCVASLLPTAGLFALAYGLRFFRPWYERPSWGVLFTYHREAIFYGLSQALLLVVLTAFLSLRIRRGAMPAGIASMIALNILTAVAARLNPSWSGQEMVMLAGACSVVAAIFLGFGIRRRIPIAAAEE